MIFVGIDWADTEHETTILDQEGTLLARFSMPHSRQDLENLKDRLLCLESSPAKVLCFQETNQGLLVQFLL